MKQEYRDNERSAEGRAVDSQVESELDLPVEPQIRSRIVPKKWGQWRSFWRLVWLSPFIVLSLSALLFLLLNFLFPLQPPVISVATTVVAADGQLLRQFTDHEGRLRHWITLEEVAPSYLSALLTYEDRYFYHHFGVNPFATLRALGQWISAGEVVSGSSTLTMQVARLLYPHPRTVMGKMTQIFRALQLELTYSKVEILTFYLNLAPMGGNIEGVAAAAERYFSKPAIALTLPESALLVALPQRPSIYRPDRSLQAAQEARNKVLKRLYDFGQIDEARYFATIADPVRYQPSFSPFSAPLLAERLRRQYPDAVQIETTIDYRLQKAVEDYLSLREKQFSDRLSAAVLIVDNRTHEVVTYVGSLALFDSERAGYVDMVPAIRSPGSTLKPFAYGLALDYGIIHEASLLTDLPRSFDGYEPQNFDKRYRGAIPAYRALQLSLNIPIVQIFQQLTPHYFVKKVRDAGITLYSETPTLSLILGGVGISLEEQIRLYSSLATAGEVYPLQWVRSVREPHFIQSEQDYAFDIARSESLEKAESLEALREKGEGRTFLSPEASWLVVKALRGVAPQKRFNSRRIAWKSGTSYGHRDAWAFGVTADWSVGVWIGRPDGLPNIGMMASDSAVPLLFDLFQLLPEERREIAKPVGIESAQICWPSGRSSAVVAGRDCLQRFSIDTIGGKIPGTLYDAPGELPHAGWPALLQSLQPLQPLQSLQTRDSLSRPTSGKLLVGASEEVSGEVSVEKQLGRDGRKRGENPLQKLMITTLVDESIIFQNDQQLPLTATGNGPRYWYLNGQLLEAPLLDLPNMMPGLYRLTVQDDQGHFHNIHFELRAPY
ncbi:penicillin-binding protein 1C [Ignatzschineria sp. F8392]|uniref:penicillin-binding protein 1C n=1 Tax=Ignatzschineria sp. F8392 TaxID=1980117 RepID=UPI000B98EF25|nr:penicillin-binding protein 1C [Ignatzschineria sp. F8392]OYQ79526.1 penicillin-binding protein 1C [Ignatzschineria sp. F8392]